MFLATINCSQVAVILESEAYAAVFFARVSAEANAAVCFATVGVADTRIGVGRVGAARGVIDSKSSKGPQGVGG